MRRPRVLLVLGDDGGLETTGLAKKENVPELALLLQTTQVAGLEVDEERERGAERKS